ncbi:MAG: RimK family alpha-L-glutamate ligase [Clostridia bacterium]|nr:RimK family alpha-L-glutamate ligase [Clostridia bacterium]
MKALILMNGYLAAEKFYRQSERLAAELEKLGVETEILRNGEVTARIEENGGAGVSRRYDFCVYLDKDKYLGRLLEKSGMRLFNPPQAVEVCDDKLSTYLALLGSGLRLIKTVSAPLCYTKNAAPSEEFLRAVEKELGFPLVAKKSYGSFGAGVKLINDREELFSIEREWLYEPHFYQAFIAEAAGKDIRVIVIGGKAFAAMERVAQSGEFRSNIELGGVGRAIELTDDCKHTAERAAQALGLDYCGVDILLSKRGAAVCEVNSNAFFEGMEAATGKNVARAYAEYIVNEMKNRLS